MCLDSPASLGDPLVDQLFEDGERHHAVVDDDRMKILDVKATNAAINACRIFMGLIDRTVSTARTRKLRFIAGS
jgi:hypothetical protein